LNSTFERRRADSRYGKRGEQLSLSDTKGEVWKRTAAVSRRYSSESPCFLTKKGTISFSPTARVWRKRKSFKKMKHLGLHQGETVRPRKKKKIHKKIKGKLLQHPATKKKRRTKKRGKRPPPSENKTLGRGSKFT